MSALEAAAKSAPDDITMLRERGLLALEMGQISDAKALLTKADAASPPDWRIKSALDSAHAASGDQAAAQCEFAAALKLVPDTPQSFPMPSMAAATRPRSSCELLRGVKLQRRRQSRTWRYC